MVNQDICDGHTTTGLNVNTEPSISSTELFIALSVLLQSMASNYPFGIFKMFFYSFSSTGGVRINNSVEEIEGSVLKKLRYPERISTSCSTCSTHHVTAKRHEHHFIWKSCWKLVYVNQFGLILVFRRFSLNEAPLGLYKLISDYFCCVTVNTLKNWSQFLFGSWRNNLNQVVHTV
jgi:hypothetical protein